MAADQPPLSISGSIAESIARLVAFGRLSLTLARAEIGAGFGALMRGVVIAVTAGVVLILSLVFLLIGLVQWMIAAGVAAPLAFAAVGGGLLCLVVLLLLIARSQIKGASLVPDRAIAQWEAAVQAAIRARPDE